MMHVSDPFIRHPLLSLAALILKENKFVLQGIEELPSGDQILVAENPYFILCLAAADDASTIVPLESLVATHLARLLVRTALGAKKWDAYIVVLTTQKLSGDPEETARLYNLNHNTSSFRRILRTGVRAELADVESALRPFLPLPKLDEPLLSRDALDELKEELPKHGVDATEASKMIDDFRGVGSIRSA